MYSCVSINTEVKKKKCKKVVKDLKGRFLFMFKWMKNVMVGSLVGVLAFGVVPATFVGAEEASTDGTVVEIPDDFVPEANVTSSITLYANGTKSKTYTLNETVNENVPYTQTYSSSDTSVAKVSANGVITAVTPGKAVITTTVSILGNDLSLKTNVTVKKPSVSITSSKKSFNVGKKYNMAAKANGLSGKIKWTSSNKKVATVNKTSGVLTAKKSGTATIKATCSGFSKSVKVTVK